MSTKFIIIEGPDSSGKTTLAKYVAQTLTRRAKPATYFHLDYSPKLAAAIQDYMESVHQNLLWSWEHLNLNVVMDRGWPTEAVYALGLNDTVRQVAFKANVLRDMVKRAQPVYIYCQCTSSLGRHQQEKKDSYQYSMLDYQRISHTYDQWWLNMRRNPGEQHFVYDLDRDGHNILGWMERCELI